MSADPLDGGGEIVRCGKMHPVRIVVEDAQLTEGEKVTVLTREGAETFHVSPEQKRELLQSIAQAKRGEFEDSDELIRSLDEAN